MAFLRGDLVLVPFPFSDLSTTKVRPAVVISSPLYHSLEPDLLLAAITSRLSTATGPLVTDVFGGRYLDRFVRHAGHWRITKRVYVLDWQRSFETDAAAEAMPGLVWSNGFTPAHPLYRKL